MELCANDVPSEFRLKVPERKTSRNRKVSFKEDGTEVDGEERIIVERIVEEKAEAPQSCDRRHNSYDEDDEGSLLSLPAELPSPPDGGWGWAVVFASFLCNMVVDGVSYSFSPYLGVYSSYFKESQGTIAWVPSLLAGVYLSVGPIVSSLSNKYGCRRVCISGGVVAAIAYASTIFATRIEYLMVTQGIIAGFGFGLVYLPAVVSVGYYFETKRALATGIAVCGSGVGTMVFPIVMNKFIEDYGWKGTNLIVSALILNCCWFGGLMRPLKVPKMKKKDLLHRLSEEKKVAKEAGSPYGSNYMTVTHSDGTVEKRQILVNGMNADPGVHSHLNLSGYLTTPAGTNLPTIQEGPPHSDEKISTSAPSSAPEEEEKKALVEQHQVKHSFASGASKGPPESVPRNKSQPSLENNGQIVPKILSVPNFERRMSRIDAVGHMKLIPATPEASYTNLRSLNNSQDLRRSSGSYPRGASVEVDAEVAAALRQRRPSKDISDIALKPMSRQDIFYSGSIRNLDEFKSQASFVSYRESTVNIHGIGAPKAVLEIALEGIDVVDEKGSCCAGSISGTLGQMVDMSLLKNPVFVVIGFANLFGMLGFYTPFVYLPAAAIEKGIDRESATFLVSIIGITNTVGRVLSGLLADIPWVSALWVNNICVTLSAICVFLTPFATSYGAFVCIAVFFGFFVSAFIALTSIILVDLLGLRLLTSAFGIICIFRGIAGILGPPVAGSIFDATQSYDVSFYCAGGLLFMCSFLHCIVPLMQRFCQCYDSPVRYTTNEEYLHNDDERLGNTSPDVNEAGGITFEIKSKGSGGYNSASVARKSSLTDKSAVEV